MIQVFMTRKFIDKTAKKVMFFENEKGLTGKNGKEMNFALYADYQ